MKTHTITLIALLVAGLTGYPGCAEAQHSSPAETKSGFYSYVMKTIDGVEKPLSGYEGKILLVVNTASKCGYTLQYAALEKLYNKYKGKDFMILAFPANNFLQQEPGTDEEIKSFCTTKYDVTFDLFSKISVKGEDIHPLYKYLTNQANARGEITWNFNKFLLDRTGKVVKRFESGTDPLSEIITQKIDELL